MPRLFIAARLPESLLHELLKAQAVMAAHARQARLVAQGDLHLTLRFIGDADERLSGRIIGWFSSLALPAREDLLVSLAGFGAFQGRDGELLYAALEVSAGLAAFQRRLETGVRQLGVSAETRPFFPHVTLARKARLTKPLGTLPLDASWGTPLPPPAITLYESILTPGGAEYRPLASINSKQKEIPAG